MALTNFYMQTTGSDLNAGSTTADAAAHTYAGGTFVRATGVFTVASGNPSSDGVAVGDWVSIYTTSGAVTTKFVGQCTARDTTTITVDVTTNKMGLTTAVSETAAATTAKVGGAWASEVVLASGGLGNFTFGFSAKVNIKAGTYTVVASRTTQFVGTVLIAVWLSGYNTTPGDLDNDTTNSLAKPVFAMNSTFTMTFTSNLIVVTGLSFTGSVTGNVVNFNGQSMHVSRCRVENTSSNAGAVAAAAGQATQVYQYCWFKTPTTATTTGTFNAQSSGPTFYGCVFEGGGIAGLNGTTGAMILVDCVCLNNTGSGVLVTTGQLTISGLTVISATVDGVKWTSTVSNGSSITRSAFLSCAGTGINNASGANAKILISCCDFYNCGTNTAGLGDYPTYFGQTDSSLPVKSASDMTPVKALNLTAHGFPGIFENQSYTSYRDIGAVQQSGAAETAVVFGG